MKPFLQLQHKDRWQEIMWNCVEGNAHLQMYPDCDYMQKLQQGLQQPAASGSPIESNNRIFLTAYL